MLWHLLRQLEHVTAYYEPCHDNLLEHVRGNTPVQESHYAVDSYWDEYQPLMDRLPALHANAFGVSRLSLEASDDWPELERYLRFLLERSVPRRPVLQMNRVDFRLPWLKARFPDAIIVHLFRNPRDQWLSMTRGLADDRASDPDENTNYDLVVWAVALSEMFPFLVGPHIRHSYERHYLIWKLSYLMGVRCSTVSLSYDDDFRRDPRQGLTRLLRAIGVSTDSVSQLEAGVRRPSRQNELAAPARADWEVMEASCDALLDRLGLTECFGTVALADIRRTHGAAWEPFAALAHGEAIRLGGVTLSRFRSHYLDTVRAMRQLGENARNVEAALLDTERRLRGATGAPPVK